MTTQDNDHVAWLRKQAKVFAKAAEAETDAARQKAQAQNGKVNMKRRLKRINIPNWLLMRLLQLPRGVSIERAGYLIDEAELYVVVGHPSFGYAEEGRELPVLIPTGYDDGSGRPLRLDWGIDDEQASSFERVVFPFVPDLNTTWFIEVRNGVGYVVIEPDGPARDYEVATVGKVNVSTDGADVDSYWVYLRLMSGEIINCAMEIQLQAVV